MPNRLAASSSPYLLQHADNPVDWWEWSEDAFDEARRRDVPVFLSVGYSSCHWCHVMAHESFEDEATASYLNEHFVSIKVDREERPDVDAVYMAATQAITGRGGWPMSVFLDHDRRPFYAGTYFPKEGRGGMPSFRQLLEAIDEAWRDDRATVTAKASELTGALASLQQVQAESDLDAELLDQVSEALVTRAWDRTHGGFGRAPKFPQAMTIGFLLDHDRRTGDDAALQAAVHSLDAMARGGIHDQVGGGFARYSTDERWLVPHFEKMLYDNGLLLDVYARAASRTGRDDLRRVAIQLGDYLLTEMQHPDGGFYSATDADSEGVEGKFFVWDADEFAEVVRSVDADPDVYAEFFGVRPAGNFTAEAAGHAPERANILHEPVPRDDFAAAHGIDRDVFASELARVRLALYERRGHRVPPGLDDKILTSWNALAIRGLARASLHLAEPRFARGASEAAAFLRSHLVLDGRLQHTWKDGHASVPAFLEDIAGLAAALLDLAAATGDPEWTVWATQLVDDALERFQDPDGGYFQTADDAEVLVTRPKETWDNATPSGNSLLASACWQLGLLTGEPRYTDAATDIVTTFQSQIRRSPTGFGELLQVAEALHADGVEVAIVGRRGPDRDRLVRAAVAGRPVGSVLAVGEGDSDGTADVALLRHRDEVDGRPAAYVCRDFVCDRPVTDPDDLRALLQPR